MKFIINDVDEILDPFIDSYYLMKIPMYEILTGFLNINLKTNNDLKTVLSELRLTFKNQPLEEYKLTIIENLIKGFLEENSSVTSELLKLNEYDRLKNLQYEIKHLCSVFFTNINDCLSDNFDMQNINSNIKINFVLYEERLYPCYELEDIKSYCIFAISRFYKTGKTINKCNNCGDLFLPQSRSDEVYCNKLHNNGRTCKMMGYENKVKEDRVSKEYRRIYKNKHASKRRQRYINPNVEKNYNDWVSYAKQIVEEYKYKAITEEDAIKKLKDSERW